MPRRLLLIFLLCAAGLGLTSTVCAEEVYVKDTLRVAVRSQPDNLVTPVAVVSTGMKLEVLDREGEFIRIKTPKGIEGWIKNTYVTETAPAILKLEQVEKEFNSVKSRLEKQQTQLQATELNNRKLSDELEQLKQENAELRIKLHEETIDSLASEYGFLWKVLLIVAIAVGGFALGMYWYSRQIRKRFGGLKF